MKRVALLVLAACDAGGSALPCAPGHTRTAHGCIVDTAAISIDGAVDDWADVPAVPLAATCTHAPCDGVLAGAIQLALSSCTAGSDDSGTCRPDLLVRVALAGAAAPVTDGSVAYTIALTPTAERPAVERDVLQLSGTTLTHAKNGFVVGAAQPAAFAFTPDGYELAIPTALLPLRGAADVGVSAARLVGSAVTPVTDERRAVACWDTEPARADPCAAEPP